MPPHKIEDREPAYLKDMLDAARLIRSYMKGMTFDEFRRDGEKQDAVAMRLMVLGEAAAHIGHATQNKLPTIPFIKIRGLRNRIAHDYGEINFRMVWDLTQKEIAPLITALNNYLPKK